MLDKIKTMVLKYKILLLAAVALIVAITELTETSVDDKYATKLSAGVDKVMEMLNDAPTTE